MPKGGLLHSHCESLLPAGWVTSVALRAAGARVDWGDSYDISFDPSTNFPLASDIIAKYGSQVAFRRVAMVHGPRYPETSSSTHDLCSWATRLP
jgi:hypothetical protein